MKVTDLESDLKIKAIKKKNGDASQGNPVA